MIKKAPNPAGLYQRKEASRKIVAGRPVSEKMAAVKRLREVERSLATVREANKALRQAKAVKIPIKTR